MTKSDIQAFPSDLRDLLTTAAAVWEDVYYAAQHASRLLVYGQPGTGKSRLGFITAQKHKTTLERIVVTPESCWAQERGFYGIGPDGMQWLDGACVRAWRNGSLALIDEIDQAGGDLIPGLHAFCDDSGTAQMNLPNGEVIRPKEGFRVIATMNSLPRALPEALCDRFVVKREIDAPDPRFLLSLPKVIRNAAAYAMFGGQSGHYSLRARSWVEIGRLMDSCNLSLEDATRVVTGPGHDGLCRAIKVANKKSDMAC